MEIRKEIVEIQSGRIGRKMGDLEIKSEDPGHYMAWRVDDGSTALWFPIE